MRVLIAGGAGCLGSNLSERLLERGHDVLVFDNLATGHRESLPQSHPRITFVEGSVTDWSSPQ
jgi:UDP-glucose 4-epimerase